MDENLWGGLNWGKHLPSTRLIQLEKVMKQYLIRVVLVSKVSCKFSFPTLKYGAITRP